MSKETYKAGIIPQIIFTFTCIAMMSDACRSIEGSKKNHKSISLIIYKYTLIYKREWIFGLKKKYCSYLKRETHLLNFFSFSNLNQILNQASKYLFQVPASPNSSSINVTNSSQIKNKNTCEGKFVLGDNPINRKTTNIINYHFKT